MKTHYLGSLIVVTLLSTLVACGSGAGEESSSSRETEPVGEVRSEVPSQAFSDGQSFVNWLQTLFAGTDLQTEPIRVDSADVGPIDEAAEPRML